MENIEEKITKIKEEISQTPYHKGTEHYIGKLKARIARFEDELWEKQSRKHSGGQAAGGFAIAKHGDATIALVGFPSVGKSTLLNGLTTAQSRVAPYAFTTVTVIPGMMEYQGARIQILDLPGLVGGAALGRGRGKEILSVVRGADLLLLVIEKNKEDQLSQIQKELYEAGVRINQLPPQVVIKKTLKGGIQTNYPPSLGVAEEFRLTNATIQVKGKISLDELVDAFISNRVYLPSLTVVNKIDQTNLTPTLSYKERENIYVSGLKKTGLEQLKQAIWQALGFMRVYLKSPDKEPDLTKPLILKKGQLVKEAIAKISQEISVSQAKIWGTSARFPGQTVSLNHHLQDGDILTF